MSDLLKDPKVIIGILAIINAIVLALISQWWRNRKVLFCEIVSDIPLFNVQQGFQHRVQVLVDGKSVQNVHLVIMKVVNSGRVPIDEKDFIIPVSVSFGEKSETLTAEITNVFPSDLPAKIIYEKRCVTIEPLMLNRGDAITIQVLVSKLSNPIRITGRVKGIPQLKKHGTSDGFRDGLGIYVLGLIVGWFVVLPLVGAMVEADLLKSLGFIRYVLYLLLILLVLFTPAHLISKKAEKELERLE
jgi:hypothetical protein